MKTNAYDNLKTIYIVQHKFRLQYHQYQLHLNFEETIEIYSYNLEYLLIKTLVENRYIIQKYKKCFTLIPNSSGSCTTS